MTRAVRFVHAADTHLDAPFRGVSADDARIGAALAQATFAAFDRVIEVCLERGARFLVIAGDAYNSSDSSLRAQLHFRTAMQRLAEADVDVFLAHGNHDPANGWSAGLAMPDNVHVFPTGDVGRFEVLVEGEVAAVVYGRSFARAAETENLSLGYRRADDDPIAIGVLHANVGGNPDYDPYSPASLDDLRAARMDYWALGHIHKQSFLSRDPWVVYPGSTQGLNPKETGPHGCIVVDVGLTGAIEVEHVETAPVGWAHTDVDVAAAESLEAVRGLLGGACDAIRAELGCPTIVRLTVSGRTPAHGELGRAGVFADLVESVRHEQSRGEPWIWLDRVADETVPVLDLDAVRSGKDFSAELVRIADDLAADPEALRAMVAQIAAPLANSLPGYEPGAQPAQTLQAARDGALDLLLTPGGERS